MFVVEEGEAGLRKVQAKWGNIPDLGETEGLSWQDPCARSWHGEFTDMGRQCECRRWPCVHGGRIQNLR